MKSFTSAKINLKYCHLLLLFAFGCGTDDVVDGVELKTLEQKIDDLSKQVRENQKFIENLLVGAEIEFSDRIVELAGLNNVNDGGVEKLGELAHKINRNEKLESDELDGLKNILTKIKTKRESLTAELFSKHWRGFLLQHGVVMSTGVTQDQDKAVKEEWAKILARQMDLTLTDAKHRLSMKNYLKHNSELANCSDWLRLEFYHKSMAPLESPLLGMPASTIAITPTQYTESLKLVRARESAIVCYQNIMELAVLEAELRAVGR